jgi:IS30 family transposase
MTKRTRIKYTKDIRSKIWDQYQQGKSLKSIARLLGTQSSSIYSQLVPTGGIRPPERKRSKHALSMAEREEISRSIVAKLSIRTIASNLKRSPSTISREINRNGGHDTYRATQADQGAWDRALRPKRCKLASHPELG